MKSQQVEALAALLATWFFEQDNPGELGKLATHLYDNGVRVHGPEQGDNSRGPDPDSATAAKYRKAYEEAAQDSYDRAEPLPTCLLCGEPHQRVRPGKTQATCDCWTVCPKHGRGAIQYHPVGETFRRISGYFCMQCEVDEQSSEA